MTLQWTAVALFLYAEIGVLLILCLPFISPKRWQSVFRLGIWNRMAGFWNKGFLTMIIILIVLFLDAVREVRKYSGAQAGKDSKLHPNMFDHLHMKLFRAQRNLYISGFSLFLWLVMRRVIVLIDQLATALLNGEALQTQADGTNETAKKYMEDNELLKQALMEGAEDKGSMEAKEQLRKEVRKLSEDLEYAREALKESEIKMAAMKKQTDDLSLEYDRLRIEHQKLQNLHENAEEKKDQ